MRAPAQPVAVAAPEPVEAASPPAAPEVPEPAPSPVTPIAAEAAPRTPADLGPGGAGSRIQGIPAGTLASAPAGTLASAPAATPAATPAVAPAIAPAIAASASRLDEVRGRLAELESRVESAATAAAARLRELGTQEATGQLSRDLVRAVGAMLPAIRERLVALASLGAVLTGPADLDAFGMDRDLARRAAPVLDFLYGTWWRVQVRGVDRVPVAGPVIVVANHGGVLAWDALVLRMALQREHPARRDLRPLLDEHALAMPLIGAASRRLGAIAATPDAALQLLQAGAAVAVFPEGSRSSTRPWPDRYRVQRFGRGGFVKLALRTGAAIVPCAIVGSEETAVPIARTGWLSSALGMPFLRSPPSRPLATLGVVPLPARWSLRFGAPIETGDADATADPSRVVEIAERTRTSLQQMLDEDVGARRSVFV